MKNNNGYLLYMEDTDRNIIVSNNYATYEKAYGIMSARKHKTNLRSIFIIDNDNHEILFCDNDEEHYIDEDGFEVIWQDKEQDTNDYELIWFKHEQDAQEFFHKYEYARDTNCMIIEKYNHEVITYDEGVYSDYNRIIEWREVYDC